MQDGLTAYLPKKGRKRDTDRGAMPALGIGVTDEALTVRRRPGMTPPRLAGQLLSAPIGVNIRHQLTANATASSLLDGTRCLRADAPRSARLELVALDHLHLDDAGVQGE